MYPAETSKEVRFTLSDEEYKRLEALIKGKIEGGAARYVAAPESSEEERSVQFLFDWALLNQEWEQMLQFSEELLRNDFSYQRLSMSLKARLALAASQESKSDLAYKFAMQVYENHPEEYESLGALAALKLFCQQPLEAEKWLNLTRLAGGAEEAWMKSLAKELQWAQRRGTYLVGL